MLIEQGSDLTEIKGRDDSINKRETDKAYNYQTLGGEHI
jgi:hypothetical protein